jgi:hypothetical protein
MSAAIVTGTSKQHPRHQLQVSETATCLASDATAAGHAPGVYFMPATAVVPSVANTNRHSASRVQLAVTLPGNVASASRAARAEPHGRGPEPCGSAEAACDALATDRVRLWEVCQASPHAQAAAEALLAAHSTEQGLLLNAAGTGDSNAETPHPSGGGFCGGSCPGLGAWQHAHDERPAGTCPGPWVWGGKPHGGGRLPRAAAAAGCPAYHTGGSGLMQQARQQQLGPWAASFQSMACLPVLLGVLIVVLALTLAAVLVAWHRITTGVVRPGMVVVPCDEVPAAAAAAAGLAAGSGAWAAAGVAAVQEEPAATLPFTAHRGSSMPAADCATAAGVAVGGSAAPVPPSPLGPSLLRSPHWQTPDQGQGSDKDPSAPLAWMDGFPTESASETGRWTRDVAGRLVRASHAAAAAAAAGASHAVWGAAAVGRQPSCRPLPHAPLAAAHSRGASLGRGSHLNERSQVQHTAFAAAPAAAAIEGGLVVD